MIDEHHYQANLKTHHYDPNQSYGSDFFDYSDGRRRQTKFKKSAGKTFKIRSDVPTQPGHGPRTKRGFISRTKEGKFVLEDDSDEGEGGFELELPPNRFRTRSVAIVAGYSPERLYSNMPPGAFVVESGVYKVGADRAHEKHEPIYWKQVVYGARGGSDGSGTIPRRVGKLVEEDLQRLRALEPQSSLVVSSPQWGGAENLEVRTNNPPRLHASSPLYQGAPLIEWTSPINNYSDLSSVPHNSVERSIPSTLLTSPNFSSNIENSSSSRSQLQQHRSQRSNESQLLQHRSQRSLKTIHEEEPRSSVSIVQAEVYPHAPNQPPRDGRPTGLFMNQRDQDLYWQRTTYQNAESMFPNYALNYPAPIHGNLSPSLQYPPQLLPRFGFEEIGIFPHPSYYQNPLATSSPPVSRSQRVGHDPGYVDMSRTISVPPIAPRAIVTSPGYHDYENTRYCSHKPGEAPPLYVAPPQPQYPGVRAHQRNRKTAVIDGAVRRIRPAQVTEASRQIHGARGDAISLVSEVLDAEVTALTSSPGSTTSRSSGHKPPADPTEETLLTETTSSSGIMSKNSSSQNRTTSSSSTGQQQIQSSEQSSPFYENWPMQHRSSGSGLHVMPASDSEPLPPLLPHGNQLQPEYQDPDTSLETPPGAVGGASGGLSRPSSSHSAPFLDLSIDRHYEFDSARTPTDDLVVQQAALDLPRTWARPYLGYNPRTRDRELGPAAELAKKERVFSDSEIYSPVFPRGRPDPTIDISARVQAMKKEFAEYRSQKLREQQKIVESKPVDPLEEPPKPPVSPTMLITHLPLSIRTASTEELEVNPSERLESII